MNMRLVVHINLRWYVRKYWNL